MGHGLKYIAFYNQKYIAPCTVVVTSSNGNIFRVTGYLCGEFTGEFPSQRPVTQSFDVFFYLRLNKRLSKQSRRWWFETPSRHHDIEFSVNIHFKYRSPMLDQPIAKESRSRSLTKMSNPMKYWPNHQQSIRYIITVLYCFPYIFLNASVIQNLFTSIHFITMLT